MIKCAIIDDEPWAIDLLKSYVEKIDYLQLIFTSENPVQALNLLHTQKIDLVFLDIQMPEMNGLDLLQVLDPHTRAILTTAYSEYALQGYEHNVTDYLLKPIEFARFVKSVQKAKQSMEALQAVTQMQNPPRNFLFIKTDGKLVKILHDEILFIEGLKDYIAIHTTQDKLISLDSLFNMESVLPSWQFCRIHKSFIVAINKIETIEKNRVFIKDHVLPVGEQYKARFMNALGK